MKKFSKKFLSIILSILMVVSILPAGMITVQAADSKIEKAISWAIDIANNNYYGYHYGARHGNHKCSDSWCNNEDFDCSSFVCTAFKQAGFDVSIVATSSMQSVFKKAGFTVVGLDNLQRGDILLNSTPGSGHTAIFLGWNDSVKKNTIVHASGNYNSAKGGYGGSSRIVTGTSSTGADEISERTYYAFATCALRYKGQTLPGLSGGEGGSDVNTSTSGGDKYNHYNANAKFDIGTYKCTYRSGVNMRTGPSTDYKKIGSVPYNWDIYVWKTNGNWGYGKFAGKEGWVCLDYFQKQSIPEASTPSINISATDIATNGNVTISYSSSNAAWYNVYVDGNRVCQGTTSTSYSVNLSSSGKHSFYVIAYNSAGKASSASSTVYCTAHDPSTVTFVDWNGAQIDSPQKVDYGKNATAPVSPTRKGYTFQGWDGNYANVTSDRTIKALYKINTYTVNFFDREGTLIDSQKVTYGSDAIPPTDKHEDDKYKFLGWNNTDYIDVYTDRADKNINVDGIYSWYNYDLPTVCENVTATRQYDGYYVTFNIVNNDSLPTTGRAVVSLKTAEGKLVDMTESTAFSIPAGKTKSGLEVFVPCSKTASKVEVFMVSNYSSGVPISPSVTKEISQGLMYAESTVEPDNSDGTLDVQVVTQYSYRDKEFSTGNTKTKDGWTWDGTRSEKLVSQSGWLDYTLPTYDNESERKSHVNTQNVPVYGNVYKYCYLHIYKPSNGNHTWCPVWHGSSDQGYQEHAIWIKDQLTCWGNSTCRTDIAKYGWYDCPWNCGANQYWFRYSPSDRYDWEIVGSKNQYWYNTYQYSYNFYRWKSWSDWSDTEVTANSNRDVKTRTIYRYQSNEPQIEDNSGITRTVTGNVDPSFAGKQITLFVYGYTGASDYTNQYIGQSVVGSDGSYSFEFKLREEPSTKTGDFTVSIGVEGATDTTVIDTIEAPKPTYTVNFYDWDGTIIETQTVTKGENATAPSVSPTREGYDFVGWDKTLTNILTDTDVYAEFEKKECTVIFVDWQNQMLKVQKFAYGDPLATPDVENIEGYSFTGWDKIIEGNSIVTQDMVVSAVYEANEYTVKFYDFDNNVIDTQILKYGENAIVPDEPEKDNCNFAGWFNPEEYQNVSHDASIFPEYFFDETTEIPTASHETGEYEDAFELTLTANDSNDVIYYYLDDDESSEKIYTKPIVVDKTTTVTYYATSLGKNDSEKATNYYCINTDEPSGWMLYSELPNEVKSNAQDFNLESDTGYRYKNTVSTDLLQETESYLNSGWTYDSYEYSSWTDWQDEEIAIDNSKIDFEIETQQAPDTTVTNYQYSHYKYVDDNGETQYSPTEMSEFSCTYETITLENRLSIAGFDDNDVSYYIYNDQTWFKQTKVNGTKTQYRSRYKINTYYKWTNWTTDAPSSNETRVYETDDVFRYTAKKYHIVYVNYIMSDFHEVMLVEDGKTIDANEFAIDGYDFDKFYYDECLVDKYDNTVGVTETLTLFANYIPKKYTVVFQMIDGTELDTQTVNYMEAAIPPDTDSVPGFVFAGWDKEFDCITEDTVITGKYVKSSQYAYISLSDSELNMHKGNSAKLSYTITPSNLSDEEVTWSSSDNNIATVDENGNIKALNSGNAIITASVTSSREKATCTVIVNPDLTTGLVLTTNSTLNYDSLGYLRRIKFNSSVEDVKAQFQNSSLTFVKIDGTTLNSTDIVGTGTRINLSIDGNIVDTNTVVVTADMTGDGIISNRDVVMFNKYQVQKITPEECQVLAMDVNGDGYVNNKDAAMVARYLVGKETL